MVLTYSLKKGLCLYKYVSLWLDIVLNLGPLLAFVILMIIVYIYGSKKNKKILKDIESIIYTGLENQGLTTERVEIRPDEYEYRCKSKNKHIKVLTLNLKLANRTFIVQWFVNLFIKDKETLFIGTKFQNDMGVEDPVYLFHMVPYRNKGYIKRRFEYFVKYDDIPTISKDVTNKYMIKSQNRAFVTHFVDNSEFIGLMKKVEPYIEHLSLQKAKEPTEPHLSITYKFEGENNSAIVKDFIRLFFLTVNLHIKNHDQIKKLAAKNMRKIAGKHGSAKRIKKTTKKRKK